MGSYQYSMVVLILLLAQSSFGQETLFPFQEKLHVVDSLYEMALSGGANNPLLTERQIKEQELAVAKKSWLKGLNFGVQAVTAYQSIGETANGGVTAYAPLTNVQPSLGASMSVNFFHITARRNEVKKVEYELQQLDMRMKTEERRVYQLVEKRYTDYLIALEEVNYNQRLLDNQQQRFETMKKHFDLGKVRLVDLIEVEEVVNRLEINIKKSKIQAYLIYAELKRMIGDTADPQSQELPVSPEQEQNSVTDPVPSGQ
ncbi:hypothetical protein GCM10023331_27720 [Algivirga pacifica]|uniref:Outer membrane efflux protein n=2 Tax=Algivirga pacifica TaxID=1162670 RepID=A0ABP9DDU3_9BACT